MDTDEGDPPGAEGGTRRSPEDARDGDAEAALDAGPVSVVRGRAPDGAADRDATAALLDRAAATGRPAVRTWRPDRQVAFGRRDAHDPGYDRARRAARHRGYRVVERRVGGRAVAFTGRTVAFARAVPIADPRRGLDDRYDAAVGATLDALRGQGAAVVRGEPAESFCPGSHSIRARAGGKVAGVGQRIRGDAALVAGAVLVDDHEAQRGVLGPVYEALGLPLDPDAVGSVATAGGQGDPVRVARALEGALVGGRPVRIERAGRAAERTS